MRYTQTLWNSPTLDYNIFSHNRYLKSISRFVLPVVLVIWIGICCNLLLVAIPFDCYNLIRVKQLKNNNRTKQYVLQQYRYEKI